MATPGGIYDDVSLDFTSDGTTTNMKMTSAADSLTYTGTTGATDEVIISGVADPVVANDSANKKICG